MMAAVPATLTTPQALALFDSLPAVPLQAAQGAWRGEGMHTGHPLDGLLEACHWHGKRIDGSEHVQPLALALSRKRKGIGHEQVAGSHHDL